MALKQLNRSNAHEAEKDTGYEWVVTVKKQALGSFCKTVQSKVRQKADRESHTPTLLECCRNDYKDGCHSLVPSLGQMPCSDRNSTAPGHL